MLEDTTLQFSIFSDSEGEAEIAQIYDDLKALFDNITFAVTSNTLLWCMRKNLVTMVEHDTTAQGTYGYKHWAVDYSFKMQKT